ncbi:MAG: hypothetical protein K6T74_12615 [Geminicoccaceae bacterium]|nr:hypothetical protein [Geminicoccaceae bacterium]
MIEGVAVGSPAADRAAGSVGAVGVEPGSRRDRRGGSGAGLGAALSATFLGLLLVRSAAEGSEFDLRGPAPPESGTPREGDAEVSVEGEPLRPAEPASAAIAAGSVLTAGALIDTAVLTRLGGEARFDELPLRLLRPEPATVPVGGAAGQAAQGAAPVTIAPAAPPVAEPPIAAPPSQPEEDLGPIGEEIVGGDEDEVLVGGPDDDRIDGGGGDDTISGGHGDDMLAGGSGNDTVDGGPGHDALAGGAGDDTLLGGDGQDVLDGGPGDDRLDGGAGDDTMTGGTGDDTAVIGSPGDLVFEDPWGPDGGGRDTLVVAPDFGAQLEKAFPTLAKGGLATFMIGDSVLGSPPAGAPGFKQQVAPNVENVRLTGSEAHAVVGDAEANAIEGNDAANLLWGGGGDDRIRGGAGHDRLYGGPGDDLLLGDAGDDLLDGGPGDDLLYGGGGNDVYVLGLAEPGADRIFDREGANRIRIDGADPSRLVARIEGDDLHLAYDDHDLAVVVGHRGHDAALAGIEIDGRSYAPAEFLRIVEPPADDLLAPFLDPSGGAASVAIDGGPVAVAAADPGLAEASALPELFPGADLWVGEPPSLETEPAPATADEERPIAAAGR